VLQILLLGTLMLTSRIDELNCRCYDAKADCWDRFPFPGHLPSFLWKHYRQELGKKVLDIGSGTGRVGSYLQGAGFDVTCLDPSSEMVCRCKARGLKTTQTTLQAFETEEKFAIVVAILSLIHVPKEEFPGQIAKIHRFLEPEGIFILSLLKGKTEKFEEQTSGYPRFFARYSADEVRQKLSGQFQELAYHEQGDYMLFIFKRLNTDCKNLSGEQYSPAQIKP
jgi:2-polyprenyl-3-methyl-5-hydroxy-6-metoxy-1,4-benzoquinol methylase